MERFINILIIDNDPIIQSGLKKILSGRGNNLLVVNTLKEAIPVIKKKEIGIFIINIEDSEEGLNCIKSIKENTTLNNSYIIVVAKEDSSGVKLVKGMHHGAVDYITYPFNQNLIRSKIEVFKSLYYKDQRIGQLLNNIFPETVLQEFSTYGKFSPKKIDNGIVLFTDFVDFSLKSKSLKPLHLIQQLEKYFTKFDDIIQKYRLEKIKTIGDAYMALGGVTEKLPLPAVRACLAAIEIRNYLRTEQDIAIAMKKDYWEIRIGLHMGPLVAGIIGSTKFSFDVWGDTVNIAARAEANTKNGSITITNTIHKEIEDFFQTTPRGKVDIQKRGGAIEMFYLEKLKHDNSMSNEGLFPNTDLRLKCGLSSMDFRQTRIHILNRLKSLLPENLSYHDIPHTLNVEKAVIRYSKLEGLEKEEIILLRTAALFHDAGYVMKYTENEDFSIKMARSTLPVFGYTAEQIEIISNIINATKRHIKPNTILEKVMCDADYDYLGRPDYNVIANKLREEMAEHDQVYTDQEWAEYQLNFLEKIHTYYTETAQNIRSQGKQARIKSLKQKIESFSNNTQI